jgi:hypothetical protein
MLRDFLGFMKIGGILCVHDPNWKNGYIFVVASSSHAIRSNLINYDFFSPPSALGRNNRMLSGDFSPIQIG